MNDPRCWREVLIRVGTISIFTAICYFILGADAWVWYIPLAVAVLVLFKWAVRPKGLDEDEEMDSRR